MKIPEEIRKYKKLLTTKKGKEVYDHYTGLLRLLDKDVGGNDLVLYSSTVRDIERYVVNNLFLSYVRQILGDKYGERGYLCDMEMFLVVNEINIVFDEGIDDVVMEAVFQKSNLGDYLDRRGIY